MTVDSWQYQQRLRPRSPRLNDGFGSQIIHKDTTIIVSAPFDDNHRFSEVGALYVFNQTSSTSWIELQRIIPNEPTGKDHFGTRLRIYGSTMIISAPGQGLNAGAVYVYDQVPGSLFWSFTQKLVAGDLFGGQFFGQTCDIWGSYIFVGARNDIRQGDHTGSIYVFSKISSKWVQQQKILSIEFQEQDILGSLGTKFFGSDVALGNNISAIGVKRLDAPQSLVDSVYIYSGVFSSTQ